MTSAHDHTDRPRARADAAGAPRHLVVADLLRDDILSGHLGPGVPLREAGLAARFDVSRNTVREAIFTLVAEGLVRHARHRGAEVMSHTVADVEDVYRSRTLVEIAAAEHAVRRPADLRSLVTALTDLRRALAEGDWRAGTDADLAFHAALVDLAGSPRLSGFHRGLQNELRLLLLLAERDEPEPDKLAAHQRLHDLLRAGDLAALRDALRDHVGSGAANLRAVVARRGGSG